MIQIVSSPTYKKSYETPLGPIEFDYNVVGTLSNVSYTFRPQQAQMLAITQHENWASLELRGNINEYLSKVSDATAREPQIFIEDTLTEGFNYTGVYTVMDSRVSSSGNSLLRLKFPNSDTTTFYGDKSWPDNHDSQLVYKYRTRITYRVLDMTPVLGVPRNILLATQRQQLNSTGYNNFNISELAKGHVSTTGSVALQVEVTATDYFGNSESTTTDPCVLIMARNPEVNYGRYTLFNPESNGQILPTTGYRLLYNKHGIYPFYVNFVTNTIIGRGGVVVQIKVQLYNNETLVNTQFATIPPIVGLNTVDLSAITTIAQSIADNKPTSISVQVLYHTTVMGEFTEQFTHTEFNATHKGGAGQSATMTVPCKFYELDNRRDFYFSYQNGLGGLSTYLCTEYKRSTEPEIVALRNASTISNSVARETESVELTMKYTDLRGLDFLLGYKADTMAKYDGIYESQNVTRIGPDASRMEWIIKSNSYDLPNATLYKDVNINIYRPIGMTTYSEQQK